MTRVLVCGSRDWDDRPTLHAVLNAEHGQEPITTLIEGEARGADRLAAEWARSRSVPVDPYPADWRRYGRGAGAIRNQRMLDEGRPDLVIAFHPDLRQSHGTADMVRRARAAAVPVTVYPEEVVMELEGCHICGRMDGHADYCVKHPSRWPASWADLSPLEQWNEDGNR